MSLFVGHFEDHLTLALEESRKEESTVFSFLLLLSMF